MSEAERQQRRYQWMTTAMVADRCGGVATDQVLAWVRAGLLVAYDARGADARRPDYRFAPDEVERFWRSRRVNATAA